MDSKLASRIWWSLAIRGVLAILFGIVAFVYTGQTLLALVFVFGVFAVLSGIASIVAAVRSGEAHQRWGWLAASGLLSIAAGIVAFVRPGLTALAIVYLIGAWAIVTGVFEIAYALALPDTLAHPWLAALSGVLSVVFGIVLAVWPISGAITLTWLVGIYAVLYGVTMLYYAYRLQALRHEVEAAQQVTARHAPA
jgi:uncharacterized membrane protein HdeD (DUF308 family)